MVHIPKSKVHMFNGRYRVVKDHPIEPDFLRSFVGMNEYYSSYEFYVAFTAERRG